MKETQKNRGLIASQIQGQIHGLGAHWVGLDLGIQIIKKQFENPSIKASKIQKLDQMGRGLTWELTGFLLRRKLWLILANPRLRNLNPNRAWLDTFF